MVDPFLLLPHPGLTYQDTHSCLPCWPVAHTEHEHDNDQELVKVFEDDEDDPKDIATAEWAVLWERKRVGKDVEGEVDVGLR